MKISTTRIFIVDALAFSFAFACIYQVTTYPIIGTPSWWQIHLLSEVGMVFFFPVILVVRAFTSENFFLDVRLEFWFATASGTFYALLSHCLLSLYARRKRDNSSTAKS